MRVVLKLGFSTGSILGLLAMLASAAAVASPPTIDRQWVSDVSGHDATLNAEINPNGLPTKYKLQIDTSGNFKFDQNDGCVLHPPGVFCTQALVPGDPLPPGLVAPQEMTRGASYDSEHVSVRMSSIGAVLQPGTTYHYRAIAANGLPFVYGPAQTFTTPPTNEEPPNEDEDAEAPGTPSPEDPPSVAPQPDQLVPPAVPPFASSRPVSNQESSGQRRGDRRRVGRCARKVNRRSSGHRGRGDHRRRHKVGQRKVCARISTARIARR